MKTYKSDLFLNHTGSNAEWEALNTEILGINLFAFAYRLCHENFSQEKNLHENENIFFVCSTWHKAIPGIIYIREVMG